MWFVLDENLPPAYARCLAELGGQGREFTVSHVRDLVGKNVSDTEWIAAVKGKGEAVVISGDRRMLTRVHELEALRTAQLTTFILAPGWSNLKFWDKAWLLIRWWPKLVEIAEASPPGTIFRVPHKHGPSELNPYGSIPRHRPAAPRA
jgi:predicted nuclease of predicted toxin-antitoxin system